MRAPYFEEVDIGGFPLGDYLSGKAVPRDLFTLKSFLQYVQIEAGLLQPFSPKYPLIEPRELEPPFDATTFEHKNLPGFSMVALDRTLDYQEEPFQFDLFHDPAESSNPDAVVAANRDIFLSRLPRIYHEDMMKRIPESADTTRLRYYRELLSFIFEMDRAHVVARGKDGVYRVLGVYASFTSELDREMKRFGLSIGKFKPGDNKLYQRNRNFVYRYLMELYGYPITSERRTSAAMFARLLGERDENFFVSVIGNSDRVLTYMSSRGKGRWPLIEKIALVSVDPRAKAICCALEDGGWFIDQEHRVIILKVTYLQHKYNPDNIVEDRAISIVEQEAVHPVTGAGFSNIGVLRTAERRLVRLNDIVRGEYEGHICYAGQEMIYGTEDHVSRVKFLHSWLTKNRRTLLGYSPRTFKKVIKTVDDYLGDARHFRELAKCHPVAFHEVIYLVETLRQEFEVVRLDKEVSAPGARERPVPYRDRLATLLDFLYRERELIVYQPEVFEKLMFLCEKILDLPYFRKRYRAQRIHTGSVYEREVLDLYNEVMTQKNRIEWLYFRCNEATSAI